MSLKDDLDSYRLFLEDTSRDLSRPSSRISIPDFAPPEAPEVFEPELPPRTSLLQRAGDVGVAVGAGTVGLVKTFLGDIPALLGLPNLQDDLELAINDVKDLYSPGLKRKFQERDAAISSAAPLFGSEELGQAAAAVKETGLSFALLTNLIAENIPQLIPSAAAAGLTAKIAKAANLAPQVAAKWATRAALATGSVQQGSSVGGELLSELTDALSQISDAEAMEIPEIAQLVSDGNSLDEAKAALVLGQARKTGVAAALASLGTGILAAPVEQAFGRLAAGTAAARVGLKDVARTAGLEAVTEAAEEGSGQLFSNIGRLPIEPEQDLLSGVGVSAGIGGLAGGLMGGGVSGIEALLGETSDPTLPPPAQPAAPAPTPVGDGRIDPRLSLEGVEFSTEAEDTAVRLVQEMEAEKARVKEQAEKAREDAGKVRAEQAQARAVAPLDTELQRSLAVRSRAAETRARMLEEQLAELEAETPAAQTETPAPSINLIGSDGVVIAENVTVVENVGSQDGVNYYRVAYGAQDGTEVTYVIAPETNIELLNGATLTPQAGQLELPIEPTPVAPAAPEVPEAAPTQPRRRRTAEEIQEQIDFVGTPEAVAETIAPEAPTIQPGQVAGPGQIATVETESQPVADISSVPQINVAEPAPAPAPVVETESQPVVEIAEDPIEQARKAVNRAQAEWVASGDVDDPQGQLAFANAVEGVSDEIASQFEAHGSSRGRNAREMDTITRLRDVANEGVKRGDFGTLKGESRGFSNTFTLSPFLVVRHKPSGREVIVWNRPANDQTTEALRRLSSSERSIIPASDLPAWLTQQYEQASAPAPVVETQSQPVAEFVPAPTTVAPAIEGKGYRVTLKSADGTLSDPLPDVFDKNIKAINKARALNKTAPEGSTFVVVKPVTDLAPTVPTKPVSVATPDAPAVKPQAVEVTPVVLPPSSSVSAYDLLKKTLSEFGAVITGQILDLPAKDRKKFITSYLASLVEANISPFFAGPTPLEEAESAEKTYSKLAQEATADADVKSKRDEIRRTVSAKVALAVSDPENASNLAALERHLGRPVTPKAASSMSPAQLVLFGPSGYGLVNLDEEAEALRGLDPNQTKKYFKKKAEVAKATVNEWRTLTLDAARKIDERSAKLPLDLDPAKEAAISEQRKKIQGGERMVVQARLTRALKGETSLEFAARDAAAYLTAKARERAEARAGREIVRGPDWLRERLFRAKRTGELPDGTVDFALWLIDRNPELVADVAISIRERRGAFKDAAGAYNPITRTVAVFTGRSKEGTAVHEILHHVERLMPDDVRAGIRDAWAKALTAAVADKTNTPQRLAALKNLAAMQVDSKANEATVEAFRTGVLKPEDYALTNPSEFWAVNATRILGDKRGAEASGWVSKARQWLREFVQKVKGWFNIPSDAAVLAGLQGVLDGTYRGTNYTTSKMLSQEASAEALNLFNDLPDFGQELPDTYARPDDISVAREFNEVANSLAELGVQVDVEEAAGLLGGEWNRSTRSIRLMVSDLAAPSVQGFHSLLHEAAHVMLDSAPEGVRSGLRTGVEALSNALTAKTEADRRVGGGYQAYLQRARDTNTSPLSFEEWAEEVVVETAALQGIDREVSSGYWSSIWRAVKDAYLQVIAYLTQKAGLPVDADLTLRWLNNRIDSLKAGDLRQPSSIYRLFPRRQITNAVEHGTVFGPGAVRMENGAYRYARALSNDGVSVYADVRGVFAEAISNLMVNGSTNARQNAEVSNQVLGETVADIPESYQQALARIPVQRAYNAAKVAVAVANEIDQKFLEPLFDKLKIPPVARITPAQRAEATRRGIPLVKEILTKSDIMNVLGLDRFEPGYVKSQAKQAFNDTISEETRQESGLTLPEIDNTQVSDLRSETEVDQLDLRRYITARNMTTGVKAKRNKLAETIKELEATAEEDSKVFFEASEALQSAEKVSTNIRVAMRKHLSALKREMRALENNAEARGQNSATLVALTERMSQLEATQKIDDRLFAAVDTDIESGPLLSGINALAEVMNNLTVTLDKSIDELTAAEIRDAVIEAAIADSRSGINYFAEDGVLDLRRSAALTAAIAVVKNDRLLVEQASAALNLAGTKAQELEAARVKIRSSTDEQISALREEINKVKRPSNRAIAAFVREYDRTRAARLKLLAAKRDLEIVEKVIPVLEQYALDTENNLQVGIPEMTLTEGETLLFEVKDLTAPDADILTRKGPHLNIKFNRADLPPEKLLDIVNTNEVWLKDRESKPGGRTLAYRAVKRQTELLKRELNSTDVFNAVHGFTLLRATGVGKWLTGIGTRAAKTAEKMFHKFESLSREFEVEDTRLGNEFERLQTRWIRTFKLSGVDEFNETVLNPIGALLQEAQVQNEQEALDVARYWLEVKSGGKFDQAASIRNKDPNSKLTLAKELFAALKPNIRRFSQKVERTGGMEIAGDESLPEVLDPTADRNAVRPTRRALTMGASGLIWPRSLSSKIRDFANRTVVNESKIYEGVGVFSKDFNPQTVMEIEEGLTKAFGADVWASFVGPVLSNPLDAVPSPSGAGNYLTHSKAEEAALFAQGSFTRFINHIMRSGEAAEGITDLDYAKVVSSHLQSKLAALVKATKSGRQKSMMSMASTHTPGFAAFSREAATFPPEWTTLMSFGVAENRSTSHALAERAAFGSDYTLLERAILDMNTEAGARRNEILDMLPPGQRDESNLGKLPAAIRAEYERLGKVSGSKYLEVFETLKKVLNPDNGILGIDTRMGEILSLIYTLMTSGFRSGLKNPVSLINAFSVSRSFGPKALADFVNVFGLLTKYGLNSLASSFGFDPLKNDPELAAIKEAGVYDPINYTRVLDPILAPSRGLQGRMPKDAMVLRMMRELLFTTRVGFNYGTSTPALRVNPFSFTQSLVNVAATVQIRRNFEYLTRLAAKFYLNGGDRNRPITPKDLGFGPLNEEWARNMMELMSNEGINLEFVGAEAADASRSGKPYTNRDIARASHMVALRDIAGESMPTSRAMFFQGSRFAKGVLGTFTGWAMKQTMMLMSTFTDRNNRLEFKSALRGLALLAAATLPATLAYSFLLDVWDDLIDRPRNKQKLTAADGELAVRGVADALVDAGTLGFLGDGFGSIVGVSGGRGLSNMLSIDSRVPAFSVAQSLIRSFTDLFQALDGKVLDPRSYETLVWEEHLRRFSSAFGANGMLQNLYILNKITDNEFEELPVVGTLFRTEREYITRLGVDNLIRSAAIAEGIEGARRSFTTGYVRNPVSDWASQMVRKAMVRDEQGFVAAYEGALAAARRFKPLEDPERVVRDAYARRSPLTIGSQKLYASEFERLLTNHFDADAAGYIREAVADYNSFGLKYLKIDPFLGTPESRMSKVQQAREDARRRGLTYAEYLRVKARELEDEED